MDHTEWMEAAELLKSEISVILPDIRGHGSSPSPDGKYKMENLAVDVIVILDHFKIEQAYIADYSMGGYIMPTLPGIFPTEF